MADDVIKQDTLGRMLEHQVNSAPLAGGAIRKASYCAHEGRMYVDAQQANRAQILAENRRLYLENKGRRKGSWAQWPMSIPETDYAEIYRKNPWLRTCGQKERTKFFKKLYKNHPEYRIG